MKIVLVASLSAGTGNRSTAVRLRGHLESDSAHSVRMVDVHDARDKEEFAQLAREGGFDAVVGIHAYRAGRLLVGLPLPYCLVFGGTDINEHTKDERKLAVMRQAVAGAASTVSFAPYMRERAVALMAADAATAFCIPPSIVPPSVASMPTISELFMAGGREGTKRREKEGGKETKERQAEARERERRDYDGAICSFRESLAVPADAMLLLLPCGIRPVKDPLYLAAAVSQWHAHVATQNAGDETAGRPLPFLVLIGPVLDAALGEEVERQVAQLPGVLCHPPVPQEVLHQAVLEADAVVNSSLSEGVSNVILEAMCLGTPVIARDVPGNKALVSHGRTGAIFSSPEQFVELSKTLRDCQEEGACKGNSVCWRAAATAAQQFATTDHSVARERELYVQHVADVLQAACAKR